MRWPAAIFALALSLTACTERVLLKESSESIPAQDAMSSPPPRSALDAGDGSHRDSCSQYRELKQVERRYAEVMILLDRSTAIHHAFGASTKLAAIKESVAATFIAYESSIKFGLIEYPGPSSQNYCNDQTCCAGLLIKPEFSSVSKMVEWVSCKIPYSCPKQTADTPLHLGLGSIYNLLKQRNSQNSQTILLFTAADAGCAGEWDYIVCNHAIKYTRDLAEMRIPIITFAIGWNPPAGSCIVDISKKTLSGKFERSLVPIETESELTTQLENILTTLSKESCEITLVDGVHRPEELVVTFDGVPVGRDRINGWDLKDSSRIQFYGNYCDRLRTRNTVKINFFYKCS